MVPLVAEAVLVVMEGVDAWGVLHKLLMGGHCCSSFVLPLH